MANIELQRLRLRRFKLSDLPNMIELESDPDVMKFTPSRVPLSAERSKERLQDLISKEFVNGDLGAWAAEFKDTGDFLGFFMLLKRDLEFTELGFMIVKRHWGKGLTAEAARGLVDYGFTKLNLQGISAATTQDNFASKRVLAKVGFIFDKKISISDKILQRDTDLDVFVIRK
jgi:ribosomal-protein-alanine N-acetyltransferase